MRFLTMRKLIIAVLVLALSAISAHAFRKGSGSIPWTPLKVYAGGKTTNLAMSSDYYIASRIDVYGGYLLNTNQSSPIWNAVINNNNLNTSWLYRGNNNGSPVMANWQGGPGGIEEIVFAPTNPLHMMMQYNGLQFYSTDRATTWQLSDPASGFLITNSASNGGTRNKGQKGAFDPNNENIAYMQTPFTMLFKSTDGGATWLPVNVGFAGVTNVTTTSLVTASVSTTVGISPSCTGVSAGYYIHDVTNGRGLGYVRACSAGTITFANGNTLGTTSASVNNAANGDTLAIYATTQNLGVYGIAIDPATVVGGVSQKIYLEPDGAGLWVSVDGGSTWTSETGGTPPTNGCTFARVVAGAYICSETGVSAQTRLFKYTGGHGGTWSQLTNLIPAPGSDGIAGFAVDPSDATHWVVATRSGYMNITHNSGSTWDGWSNGPTYSTATNPWLPVGVGTNTGFIGLEWDGSGRVWTCGSGCAYITVPGNSSGFTPLWIDASPNTLTFVGLHITAPPGTGYVFGSAEDKAIFRMDASNVNYGSLQYVQSIATLSDGWDVGYAISNPSFLIAIVNTGFNVAPDLSAWSTDSGTTWKKFGVDSATQCPGGGATQSPPNNGLFGGQNGTTAGIAAVSTPCNFIWSEYGIQPWLTQDGGQTWSLLSLVGVPGPANGIIGDNVIPQATAPASSGTTSIQVTSCAGVVANMSVRDPDAGAGGAVKGAVASSSPCVGNTLNLAAGGLSVNVATNDHLMLSYWQQSNSVYNGAAFFTESRAVIPNKNSSAGQTFYLQFGWNCTPGSGTTGHPEYGVYKSVNGGVNWVQMSNTCFGSADWGLLSVPGKPNDLFHAGAVSLTNLNTLAPVTHPVSTFVYYLSDSGADCSTACQTWTQLANVKEATVMAVGAPSAPGNYPAIYIIGYVDTGGGYTYGLWRCNNFNAASPGGVQTWTKLDTTYPGAAYPFGNIQAPTEMVADSTVYGKLYVAGANYNWVYAIFP